MDRGGRANGRRRARSISKGARRGALSMYRDALELDPLNAEAILGLGFALIEQEKLCGGVRCAQARTRVRRRRRRAADRDGPMRGGVESKPECGRLLRRTLKIEPRNLVSAQGLARAGPHAGDNETRQRISRCTERPRICSFKTVPHSLFAIHQEHSSAMVKIVYCISKLPI